MRRFLVLDAINANTPDIMGFQEAFARPLPLDPGQQTQQVLLGQVFNGTHYRFYTWEVVNEYNPTASEDNWNPIIVNTARFNHVAAGSRTVNFETHLGSDGQTGDGNWDWDDYFRLHEIFHDFDPDAGVFSAHSLAPERYINWVVSDDRLTSGKVVFLTSHYETFIGSNNYGPNSVDAEYNMTYGALFVAFSNIVNESSGHASAQIDAQASDLRALFPGLGVIIGGDFETGDPTLPSQQVFTDAGYEETYRFMHPGSGTPRPTQGIDVMWAKTSDFDIEESDYDRADYTSGSIRASDHKPLFAVFAQIGAPGHVPFTDNPVVPTVTIVRAVHVQEMRDRITALRVARNLAAFLWTDPVLFATMSVITANHMQELRTALAAVYAEDGDEDPTYTNQVATGAVISALDVNETRAAIVNRE